MDVRMPIYLNDFVFLDETYRHALKSFLEAIKAKNCILTGCKIRPIGNNNFTIDPGVVSMNSEMYVCPAQSFTAASLEQCFFEIQTLFLPIGNRQLMNGEIHKAYKETTVKVVVKSNTNFPGLHVTAPKLSEVLVYQNDVKLTNSRTCNNNFDNVSAARNNLGVYSKNYVSTALNNKAWKTHAHNWSEIRYKPQEFEPRPHTHNWSDINEYSNLFDYNHINGFDDTEWKNKSFFHVDHGSIFRGSIKYRVNRRNYLEVSLYCNSVSPNSNFYGNNTPFVTCPGIPAAVRGNFLITSVYGEKPPFLIVVSGSNIYIRKIPGYDYYSGNMQDYHGNVSIPIIPSGNSENSGGGAAKSET